jgi:uncharacterized OsmC-like protein
MQEMKILNKVNLSNIQNTISLGKKDVNALKKTIQIEGEWVLDEKEEYQFKAEAKYGKGKAVFEIDSPIWLGGNDTRPGPMLYCLAGLSSCFLSTFVTIASMSGIKFKTLKVRAECKINFSKVLEISDEPIIEEVNFFVKAEPENISKDSLKDLLDKAQAQCPAIYSLTHIIKTKVHLE